MGRGRSLARRLCFGRSLPRTWLPNSLLSSEAAAAFPTTGSLIDVVFNWLLFGEPGTEGPFALGSHFACFFSAGAAVVWRERFCSQRYGLQLRECRPPRAHFLRVAALKRTAPARQLRSRLSPVATLIRLGPALGGATLTGGE